MATVSYVGVGTVANGTNGSPDLGVPAGINAGDLLVAVIGWRGTATFTSTGFAEMSGSPWAHASSGANEIHVLTGIATGKEGATITFTKSGGGTNQTFNGFMFAVRSSNGSVPVLGNNAGKTDNASAANIGPITGFTPGANDSMVVVIGHRADDWTGVATLTGDSLTWNEIAEPASTSGTDAGTVADYAIQTTAAAISNKTFTVTGGAANTGLGVMISIKAGADLVWPPALTMRPIVTSKAAYQK